MMIGRIKQWSDQFLYLMIALIILILPIIFSNSYYIKILIFIMINVILVIGLSLLMGYAGQISLGHAAFFGIGAYASAILTTKYQYNFFVGITAAIFITALVALLVGGPTLRLKGHYLAMATLGFGEICYILFVELGKWTGGPDGLIGIPLPTVAGRSLTQPIHHFYLTGAIALGLFILARNIIDSRVGRAFKAVHGSEIAAQAMGINVGWYKVQIFVFSAALAGIAGSLYAHLINFISPSSFNLTFSIVLVTMVVIGGMHSIWGAVLGAIVMTALPEYLRVFKEYDLIIYALILITVMVFMPGGLVSLAGKVKILISGERESV